MVDLEYLTFLQKLSHDLLLFRVRVYQDTGPKTGFERMPRSTRVRSTRLLTATYVNSHPGKSTRELWASLRATTQHDKELVYKALLENRSGGFLETRREEKRLRWYPTDKTPNMLVVWRRKVSEEGQELLSFLAETGEYPPLNFEPDFEPPMKQITTPFHNHLPQELAANKKAPWRPQSKAMFYLAILEYVAAEGFITRPSFFKLIGGSPTRVDERLDFMLEQGHVKTLTPTRVGRHKSGRPMLRVVITDAGRQAIECLRKELHETYANDFAYRTYYNTIKEYLHVAIPSSKALEFGSFQSVSGASVKTEADRNPEPERAPGASHAEEAAEHLRAS